MLTDHRHIASALDKLGFGARSTIYEVLLRSGLDCGYVICIIYEVLLKSDLGCGYVICIILVAVLLRW